jgi:hypothetical protein
MNKHSLHPPYSLIFVIGQGLSDSIYIGAPRFYAYVNSKKILIEMIIKQKIYSVLARDLEDIYYMRCTDLHRTHMKMVMRSVKRRNKWPTMRSVRPAGTSAILLRVTTRPNGICASNWTYIKCLK